MAKKIIIAAGLIAALGAAAAIAQGHREGRGGMAGGMGGGMHGMGMGMGGGDGDMQGRRGWFGGGRAMTQDEHDARTRERFARLDKNGDGILDLAEIEAGLTGPAEGRLSGMRERMGGGGQPGERLLRRFDTNKDGKVSKDEFLAEVRKIFAEADLNNDNKIDDADLPPMMRGRNAISGDGREGLGGGRFSRGGEGGGMLGFLRGADANKDGVITVDEAVAFATKQFDTFDRNKDAAIDKADFDALRKDMLDYRVKRFVHQFDADKDGKVTKDQFYAKAKERFARMDFNNDGRITRDDMGGKMGGEHREGMRERMRGWMGRGERGNPDAPTPNPGAPAPKN